MSEHSDAGHEQDDAVDAMLSAILEDDAPPKAIPLNDIWGKSVLVQAFTAALSEYKVRWYSSIQTIRLLMVWYRPTPMLLLVCRLLWTERLS